MSFIAKFIDEYLLNFKANVIVYYNSNGGSYILHLLRTAVSKPDVQTLRTVALLLGPMNAFPYQNLSVVSMNSIISDVLVPPLVK